MRRRSHAPTDHRHLLEQARRKRGGGLRAGVASIGRLRVRRARCEHDKQYGCDATGPSHPSDATPLHSVVGVTAAAARSADRVLERHTCRVGVASVSRLKEALDVIIASLGLPGVVSGARLIDPADSETLHAVERSAVSAAVPARRAEFASGRALLRSLIGHDGAIPVAADRRPLLPTGVRASLAHDGQFVVAVSSRSDDIASLGIDIEPDQTLEPGIVSVIARPDEREIDPLVLFCAKEAAYKAWSQCGGGFLEHADVRVRLAGAMFTAEVLECGVVIDGGWARIDGRCVTVAVLRHLTANVRAPSSTS